MKRKIDFVTNSSSTSFVIADYRKDQENLKTTILIETDLNNFILKTLKTEEEFFNYYLKEYGYETKEEVLNYTEDQLNSIKNGGVIKILHVATDNDEIESLLCNKGIKDCMLPEGVKVIRGDGGY